MKLLASTPEHGIGAGRDIGAANILSLLKEIARSCVSPTKVVKDIQRALTSVSIVFAISLTVAGNAAAPGHVTETTSTIR